MRMDDYVPAVSASEEDAPVPAARPRPKTTGLRFTSRRAWLYFLRLPLLLMPKISASVRVQDHGLVQPNLLLKPRQSSRPP